MKGYISAREASYKWGVSERRVHQYCQTWRISGVTRFGRSWVIPADAEKPTDPRKTKTNGYPVAVSGNTGALKSGKRLNKEICLHE